LQEPGKDIVADILNCWSLNITTKSR